MLYQATSLEMVLRFAGEMLAATSGERDALAAMTADRLMTEVENIAARRSEVTPEKHTELRKIVKDARSLLESRNTCTGPLAAADLGDALGRTPGPGEPHRGMDLLGPAAHPPRNSEGDDEQAGPSRRGRCTPICGIARERRRCPVPSGGTGEASTRRAAPPPVDAGGAARGRQPGRRRRLRGQLRGRDRVRQGVRRPVRRRSPARYPERYGAVDSARRISKGAPPTLILQGSRDHLVFADRAEAFADRLTKAGVTHRCAELPFLDHDYDYDSRSADNGTKAARALTLPWLQGYAGSARVHDWHRWGGSGPLRFAVGNGARSSAPARPARRWA
ncbi:hypothetical protein ACRAWF_06225 [Streptomyces sp. L7]